MEPTVCRTLPEEWLFQKWKTKASGISLILADPKSCWKDILQHRVEASGCDKHMSERELKHTNLEVLGFMKEGGAVDSTCTIGSVVAAVLHRTTPLCCIVYEACLVYSWVGFYSCCGMQDEFFLGIMEKDCQRRPCTLITS